MPNRDPELPQGRHPKTHENYTRTHREDNGHFTYRNNLNVPDHEPLRLHLMQEHHDPPAIGHPGREKTLELLQRKYYWPQMRNEVMRYIRNCYKCNVPTPAHMHPTESYAPWPYLTSRGKTYR